jgi:hypothetical protein
MKLIDINVNKLDKENGAADRAWAYLARINHLTETGCIVLREDALYH